ncbi:metal-dependent hydrolase [Natronorubrum daqingense]|uniref:Hydrolase n=1 Tax=Natronorubrum daqingense TaxID=588898 RepID=A0A1N7ABR0_9EURY|nr:metal-dependent hydrolase [Natronorubrum daqingense]APX98041.1 hydrolase [Natronorubrum daqingense]SIR36535.1 LexA-binding, inner membrane-associated putative hydrolase [Natronorubrum daqingense]
MWPWGHFGVAYIVYSLYARGRFGRPPRPEPALAVLAGSQLADLIDKPLAWWFGILPSGRSLAHSLLFAAGLLALVYAAGFALGRLETATAFAIAHLAHVLTDVPPRAFLGYPHGTEFLVWPLLEQPTFRFHDRLFEPPAVVEVLVGPFTNPAIFFFSEWLLFGMAIALWYVDGCPGLEYVRDRIPA